MAGVYLFGAADPERWGDIGKAILTLTIMLTLENFPDAFLSGLEITPFALVFFLTYMFFIVFTVLNVLIGIVLTAMDQAREEVAEVDGARASRACRNTRRSSRICASVSPRSRLGTGSRRIICVAFARSWIGSGRLASGGPLSSTTPSSPRSFSRSAGLPSTYLRMSVALFHDHRRRSDRGRSLD